MSSDDPHQLPVDAAEWDERYGESERIWSGEPNGALVDQLRDLTPGTVLDVGCGEGADAVWLARQGWRVTALDPSSVALDRAAAHAAQAEVDIAFVHAGLLELPPAQTTGGRHGYDLVSAQYPALRRTSDSAAERALLNAVAPGGRLLFVHHDLRDPAEALRHGFDPEDWVSRGTVAALLAEPSDGSWQVEVDEVRERAISGGSGAHHTHDVVLQVRRPA